MHLTAEVLLKLLGEEKPVFPIDSKGRDTDIIFVERLCRSLKCEGVYLKDYQTPREANRACPVLNSTTIVDAPSL
ncbi:MAG: hypothetical protein A4E53_00024 [Pelotomaculum sp. PtaB.Bin104]|nr:MAG: hypothetical protein A4E53_00024 [Pelotomaculum sp. PtaB.Bin104]